MACVINSSKIQINAKSDVGLENQQGLLDVFANNKQLKNESILKWQYGLEQQQRPKQSYLQQPFYNAV